MFLYTSNFFVWLRDKKSERKKICLRKCFEKPGAFLVMGNLRGPLPEGATAFLQILKGSWWLIQDSHDITDGLLLD